MSEKLIHKHSYNPFKSSHIFLLLIPSIIFAFTIAYFGQEKSGDNSDKAMSIAVVTPKPFISIKAGEAVINAEIVDDENSRKVGLSKYESLPQNQGMLFVFGTRNVEHLNFWMKDMKFPIDIIWVDDGKVIQIDEYVDPQIGAPENELRFYVNNQPIDYVLEVNAGFTKENNIFIGTDLEIEPF